MLDRTEAVFSPCGTYRYVWTRDWSGGAGPSKTLVFIMLNPSLANEQRMDPTVTRCYRRAVDGGYNRLKVLNLFAMISPYPKDLLTHPDPVGPANDAYILRDCLLSTTVIAAWGSMKFARQRALDVRLMLQREKIALHALRLTPRGEPWHPLHLPYSEQPQPWC